MLRCDPFDLVVIYKPGLLRNAVVKHIEVFAGYVYRRPVRKMPAVGKIHAEDGVARIQKRKEYGKISARSAVRLNICVFRAEKLFCTFPRDVFDLVYLLAAAVIAVIGIALRIFVREYRSGCGKDRLAHDILACDKLNVPLFALQFAFDRACKLAVDGIKIVYGFHHNTARGRKNIFLSEYHTWRNCL